MKVAFLGSQEFSLSVLQSLFNSKHKVVCVVTPLDKEVGRGHKIEFSPVKVFANKNNLPILQYKSVSKYGEEDIKSFAPDVIVSASFGQMLKENILTLCKYGVINVHSSLLPKYRGSCPINWAIINGEKTTGVTIMTTAIGWDTGDIISQKPLDILPNETAGELTLRLAKLGGEMLVDVLDNIENGVFPRTKQDETKATYLPKLDKDMARIDFNKSAEEISNFVRGINPWPIAYFIYNGEQIKVYSAKAEENKWGIDLSNKSVGEVVLSSGKHGLVVCAKNSLVLLEQIQAPNGKIMDSKNYLNGRQIPVGTNLQKEEL